jgi:RNA polymerase sigma factor (sigma-70 family)
MNESIFCPVSDRISPDTILSGWLYRTTWFACADVWKRELRRQQREQEACMEAIIETNETDPAWAKFAPVLDEAMAGLRDRDRDALVLRFFENKSIKEIAGSLGLEERAAQKRVQRALEKLRGSFTRRGITFSVTVIAGAISAHSVSAAPGPVVAMASSACVGKAANPSTNAIIQGALKAMAWAKLKFTLRCFGATLLRPPRLLCGGNLLTGRCAHLSALTWGGSAIVAAQQPGKFLLQ